MLNWLLKQWFLRLRRNEYPCEDCRMLTAPKNGADEWYVVNDEIWGVAGASDDGILCIGCLERRIGRVLVKADFTHALVNDPSYGWHSDRLRARLMAP